MDWLSWENLQETIDFPMKIMFFFRFNLSLFIQSREPLDDFPRPRSTCLVSSSFAAWNPWNSVAARRCDWLWRTCAASGISVETRETLGNLVIYLQKLGVTRGVQVNIRPKWTDGWEFLHGIMDLGLYFMDLKQVLQAIHGNSPKILKSWWSAHFSIAFPVFRRCSYCQGISEVSRTRALTA